MFTRASKIILSSAALGVMAGAVWANPSGRESAVVPRDQTYEQNLRWEASDDKDVTPAKVLRWLHGARGNDVFTSPSSTEFVPIVHAHDGHVTVVAAIAYKF